MAAKRSMTTRPLGPGVQVAVNDRTTATRSSGSAARTTGPPTASTPHPIVGNLVENPELRFTNTGIAVANLRVAVTQRIQQDGEWRDGDTSFFKVNVWRGQPNTWPTPSLRATG
jgi:hypothetical protein